MPFHISPCEVEGGPGRGKLTLRLLGGGGRALHIANSLTLPFYLLPFYLLGRTEQSNHFSTFLTVNLSLGDALTKSGEIYYFERTLEI